MLLRPKYSVTSAFPSSFQRGESDGTDKACDCWATAVPVIAAFIANNNRSHPRRINKGLFTINDNCITLFSLLCLLISTPFQKTFALHAKNRNIKIRHELVKNFILIYPK